MSEFISIKDLCRELQVKGLSHFRHRFGDIGRKLPRESANHRCCSRHFTQAEADIIRASYHRRRQLPLKARNDPNRKPIAVVITGRADSPERLILDSVAVYYGVCVDDLLAHNRTRDAQHARIAAAMLLERAGYRISAIGRILQRDHSTILHALQQGGRHTVPPSRIQHPERVEQLTREVAELEGQLLLNQAYVPPLEAVALSFDALMAQATGRHPAAGAVCAYVAALARPGRPQPAPLLYHGLHALSTDAALRGRIRLVLTRVDQPGVWSSMTHHAAKLGFAWEGAA